jgi:hypothetical protein
MSRSNCLTFAHGKGILCPHCELGSPQYHPPTFPKPKVLIKQKSLVPNFPIAEIERQLDSLSLCGNQVQRRMELTMVRDIPNDLCISSGF